MSKNSVIILGDLKTFSTKATVAYVPEEPMRRIMEGESRLLSSYAEVGMDVCVLHECIADICRALGNKTFGSDFRHEVISIMRKHKQGIFPPGVTPYWMPDEEG